MRPWPEPAGVRHADRGLPTGVRLHVAEAGDSGAPPLLAVHDWPQHSWMWRPHASSLMCRQFQLRELGALAAGRLADARVELPVKLRFWDDERSHSEVQLVGVERHLPQVEAVDGGHFLPDERPQLVAECAAAWFA